MKSGYAISTGRLKFGFVTLTGKTAPNPSRSQAVVTARPPGQERAGNPVEQRDATPRAATLDQKIRRALELVRGGRHGAFAAGLVCAAQSAPSRDFCSAPVGMNRVNRSPALGVNACLPGTVLRRCLREEYQFYWNVKMMPRYRWC